MRKMLAVLVALFAAAWFAVPAFATGTNIQICKASTSSALTGPFTFTVGQHDYTVQVGTCTPEIDVTPVDGKVAVTEVAHPWFKVAAVDYRDTKGGLHAVDPANTVQIPVSLGTTIVHFTNDPVMGTLEICKYPQEGSNARGTFTFEISSPPSDDEDAANGWIDNLPAPADVSVTVGSCSGPIAVPAGNTYVTELPTNGQLFVTQIHVTPVSRWIHQDGWTAGSGKAEVLVPPTAAALGETKVDFYNSLATLKVCKAAGDEDVIPLAPFSFTATGSNVPFLLTPTADMAVCHEVGQFAPGALVTVTEAVTPGTAVSDISLNQGFNTDPATTKYLDKVDKDLRTVSFYMQPGVDEVTFTNDPAASVPLKICKLPATLTGTYSFTTSGLTGYEKPFKGLVPAKEDNEKVASTFTVLPGQCTWVGYFPYNGTITITEASGNLTDVAIDPASTTAVLVSKNLAARSASVMLGSYDTWDQCRFHDLFPAIVNFTNGPAAVQPASTGTTTTVTQQVAASAAPATVATTASIATPTKATKSLTVQTVRIVTVGSHRYVVVRINGTAKTARIHLALLNKQHKVTGRLTRYVATNQAVRVGNLQLAKTIAGVKVTLQ